MNRALGLDSSGPRYQEAGESDRNLNPSSPVRQDSKASIAWFRSQKGRTVTTSTETQSRTASCPVCSGKVRLVGRLMIGEVLRCSNCGTQLEVASTDPLVMETLARVDEDEEDFVQ